MNHEENLKLHKAEKIMSTVLIVAISCVLVVFSL
jgi:hypothetical protein